MRKIIILLLVLMTFGANAQRVQKINNYGYAYNRLGADTLFYLPSDTFSVPAFYQSYPFMAKKGSNLYLWNTSTFIWELLSGSGSTYTFPYSVKDVSGAIQLENDTTANPANYFYGRNSAGRRGWYPQSGITGVNIYNSDGTFTGYRTVNGNYNGFEMSNISSLNIGIDDNAGMTGGINIGGDNADNDYHIRTIGSVGESGIYGYRSENKLYSVTTAGSDSSFVQTDGENGISIKAFDGSLKIPLLNYTLSTTGKKIMIRDTATGLVENIDPALIGGGGITNADNGLVKNSSGFVSLDSNGVNPLARDVLIDGNDFGVNFFNTDTVKITRDDDNGGTLALYNGSYPYTILTADGNADPALIFTNYGVISSASILTITSATSDVRIPVPSTTSTVGKKVILGDTTQNGRLYSIDPALIGGGGTPAGNYGNVQLNRNGAFATQASDTLGYTTAAGLVVKNGASIDGAVVINDSGGDKDFRVEGDTDTELIFADASRDNVNIGGAGYNSTKLYVKGKSTSALDYAFYAENSSSQNLFNITNSGIITIGKSTATTSQSMNSYGLSSFNAGTPTARVHIGAGTATANTAPIKFTSGTNLTTAEAGAMEYDGTNLFFTPSSATRNNILMTASVNSVSPTWARL